MQETERKHWRNGFNVYPGILCCAFSIGSYGVLICKPSRYSNFINVYKLI